VAPLWAVMAPWGIGVVVDFVISFSYTLAPRRRPDTGDIRPGGRPEPGDDRPAHRSDAGRAA
jgi:hypothetical protein